MIKQRSKIAIITSSLGGGGAQKSSANLSFVLSKLNYEVHIISILNQVDYKFRGQLLNLGVMRDKDNSLIGRTKRFLVFFKYLRSHNFEYVIDSRARPTFFKQFLINKVLYSNQNVIYIIHSYLLNNYFPSNRFLARWLYKNAKHLLCVSSDIKDLVNHKFGLKATKTMYNACLSHNSMPSDFKEQLPENYILYFGRIDDKVKNISLLLEAFKRSNLPNKNIELVILGDGPDALCLQQKVKGLELEDKVKLLSYVADPRPIISKAIFSTLTSRYEGFGMTLIESLQLGIPVVSVDCKSGPSEIISHKENGLLVNNHDPRALAEAFNEFVENESLYNHCKQLAKHSVERFSTEIIAVAWEKMLS